MKTNPELAYLISQIPLEVSTFALPPSLVINGIALDSRQVQEGNLFVALQGISLDGHAYIPVAVQKGAAAVLGSRPYDQVQGLASVPYLQVADPRQAMAYISAAYFDFPARSMTIIGVTGTDGKTTTSNLIYEILRAGGIQAGMISTVNAVIGEQVLDTGFHVTTPEAPEVQHYLAMMRAAGLTHVVLEVTSHGLAQHRVTACEFDIGVVTNITHEHLDYHGSYESYRDAKAMLFRHLESTVEKAQGNPRLAVLNKDDQSFPFLDHLTRGMKVKKVIYGLTSPADVWAEQVNHSPEGLKFTAMLAGGEKFDIRSGLAGDYNVSNILAALSACVVGLGISPLAAAEGVMGLKLIPGRMEKIDLGQNFCAIVDFAHTPNAILRALNTARQMTNGRVIAVFGSAGLRDREKRRLMAEVSVQLADVTILTAEDPRTESLESILAEMARAAQGKGGEEGKTFFRVPDRGMAIRMGVEMAAPGDLVIALGKGHEQSMCFGVTEYLWDDRIAMRAALAERLGIPGPEMPYLPTQENHFFTE